MDVAPFVTAWVLVTTATAHGRLLCPRSLPKERQQAGDQHSITNVAIMVTNSRDGDGDRRTTTGSSPSSSYSPHHSRQHKPNQFHARGLGWVETLKLNMKTRRRMRTSPLRRAAAAYPTPLTPSAPGAMAKQRILLCTWELLHWPALDQRNLSVQAWDGHEDKDHCTAVLHIWGKFRSMGCAWFNPWPCFGGCEHCPRLPNQMKEAGKRSSSLPKIVILQRVDQDRGKR